MSKFSLIALSAWGNPQLPYFIDGFQAAGLEVKAIVCAGHMSEKNLAIVSERTKGHFVPKDILASIPSSMPVYFVDSHNSSACLQLLSKLAPDVLMNWGTPNILSKELIALPRLGVANAHPGLLPDYRGCSAVEWAIYNDEPVGATCHFMTERIDEGPILYKEAMSIEKGSSYEKIRTNMIHHCIKVMACGIQAVLDKGLPWQKLAMTQGGKYYKVIDNDSMAVVIDKLNKGLYQHLV